MIDFYQIRSPLSQVTDERMDEYIHALEQAIGEKLQRVQLEQYLADDFALLYVASGGSEGFFLEVFQQLKERTRRSRADPAWGSPGDRWADQSTAERASRSACAAWEKTWMHRKTF